MTKTITLQEQDLTAIKSWPKRDRACAAQNYLDLHSLHKQRILCVALILAFRVKGQCEICSVYCNEIHYHAKLHENLTNSFPYRKIRKQLPRSKVIVKYHPYCISCWVHSNTYLYQITSISDKCFFSVFFCTDRRIETHTHKLIQCLLPSP